MLKFKDGEDWLHRRIKGVKKAYFIPKEVKGIAIDIGANVGAFEIVNNEKFQKIIAIEPSKETFLKCSKNVKSYKNTEVYNFAVSNENNKIVKLRHYKNDFYSGNATTLDNSKWYNGDQYEEVSTISLEGIFDIFHLKKINYLKIDCEGAEYDFLINKDLSKIDYIGIEIHVQLGDKVIELMNHINKTHHVITKRGDGKIKHFEITYKNNNLL